jgi:RND family efflux transporter MFP subunit
VQFSRELWAPRSRDIGRLPGMGLPSLFDQFFTRGFAANQGYGNPWLERQSDLYSAGVDVSTARGQMIMAESALREIDARLRDSQSLAPFSGVLVKKLAEVGDTVQPGQPLLQFSDIRSLQVQVEVPSRYVGALQHHMKVPVTLDVNKTQVEATVAQIFPVADFSRHTVTVKLDLPENTPAAPGMYVEVNMPDKTSDQDTVPVIPGSALVKRGSLPAVFVVNSQNETELRMLRLGEKLDGDRYVVLSGLRIGERIVSKPSPGMKSGKAIN